MAAVILLSARKEVDLITLMSSLKQTNRTRFKNKFLNPLLKINFIAMTIPDKPNSSQQKYIITENGRELLNSIVDKEDTQQLVSNAT